MKKITSNSIFRPTVIMFLIAVARLPWMTGSMGWRSTWIPLLSVLIVLPIAGLIARQIIRLVQ